MRPLTVTHTQRPHAAHRTSGTGPLYEGRFKSFPIQEDDQLWTVLRYVERKGVAGQFAQGDRGMAPVESLASGAWRRGGTAG